LTLRTSLTIVNAVVAVDEVGNVSESSAALSLTGQYDYFSVGRMREGDTLSMVLPPETINRLTSSCAAARAKTLAMPPIEGAHEIEDLVELLHALLGGFAKVAAADALASRSTETLQEALSEIEELRRELGK
jgi:hypothetical protein